MDPAVSVVVCTRGRPDLLDRCLQALAAQSHPGFEVIVVDNAPTDAATEQVARRFDVIYVVEPQPGLDVARNRGLAAASAPIVAFTDDDALPAPGWLETIASRFASSPEVAVVTGDVVAAELATPPQRLFEQTYRGMSKGPEPRIHHRASRRIPYLPARFGTGCNMAFRRHALEAIGGFDPALDAGTLSGGGGDLDVMQRLFEAYMPIAYAPDAVVRHHHRSTVSALQRQLYDNGRGYSAVMTAAFLRTDGRSRAAVFSWWSAWLVWWFGRRIVLRLARRHDMPLRFVLAELAGAVSGPPLYLVARRRARSLPSRQLETRT
jgi:glycosyltransferase involved in cell wall biosynthesis